MSWLYSELNTLMLYQQGILDMLLISTENHFEKCVFSHTHTLV